MSDVKIIGGQIRELYLKHLFVVHVDTWWAGFSKCSELSVEFADIDYWEGGSIIPSKYPGRATIPDVTLERGSCSSFAFYNWANQTGNASVARGTAKGYGDPEPSYRKDITILQLDRTADEGAPLNRWILYSGYAKKFVAGDWDNNADEAVIESLTIRFNSFKRFPGKG